LKCCKIIEKIYFNVKEYEKALFYVKNLVASHFQNQRIFNSFIANGVGQISIFLEVESRQKSDILSLFIISYLTCHRHLKLHLKMFFKKMRIPKVEKYLFVAEVFQRCME
jgi:hypothetical protein